MIGLVTGALKKTVADPANVLVRTGRFVYWTSAATVVTAWYSSWRNQRVAPVSQDPDALKKWPVPGLSKDPPQFSPARDDAALPSAFGGGGGGGGNASSQPPVASNATAGTLGSTIPNLIQIGRYAQSHFGLHVGEHPAFGGVHPVHVADSLHYKGRAIDVSGSEGAMRAFAAWVRDNYGKHITELIHNPGFSIKNGKSVPPSFWGSQTWAGHRNHVHVGI